MDKKTWQKHWGLSDDEMKELEDYLKETGYKILEIRRVEAKTT